MNEKEALEMLNDWSMGIITGISDSCLSVAIKALEKQIPRKPIHSKLHINDVCPICGRAAAYSYCVNCGQKLDFSEE